MTGLLKINQTLDLLLRARERLSDPANWCGDGGNADELFGLSGMRGRSMCIYRTLERLSPAWFVLDGACGAVIKAIGQGDIGAWNDSHSHDEILAAMDRAIGSCV